MDVFISWSGRRSEAVARALRDWIPLVLQSVTPWISRDIEKGSRWDDVIAERLEQSNFGIVCLTPENLDAEWLLFEAGALSKKAREARVCTYLYGLAESDVAGPLARFQHTRAERSDTRQLMDTLNRALGSAALDAERFRQTFDHWWPRLEEKLAAITPLAPDAVRKARSSDEKLDEIIVEVRNLRRAAELQFLRDETLLAGVSAHPRLSLVSTMRYELDLLQGKAVERAKRPVSRIIASAPWLPFSDDKCAMHDLAAHLLYDTDQSLTIVACCNTFLSELVARVEQERQTKRSATP